LRIHGLLISCQPSVYSVDPLFKSSKSLLKLLALAVCRFSRKDVTQNFTDTQDIPKMRTLPPPLI
jgi:hypothetical protein